jgi:hypothetical protein
MHESTQEEIELGDSEHDAFLPSTLPSLQKSRAKTIFARILPSRFYKPVSNISRRTVSSARFLNNNKKGFPVLLANDLRFLASNSDLHYDDPSSSTLFLLE